jgi:LuxR family transcriptional regulator, maltose regulon positive regulatory protein
MGQTPALSDSQAAVPLLETKLRRPTGTSLQVARPRLIQQLAASADRRLILVSAPAGYGKTVLVSDWLAAFGCPYAWLSLDEHDDDLESFLVYLVAALRTAWPHALDDFALLLNAPTLLPPHRLADALLQGLLALPGPLILVLDDYHTMTAPPIHALMVRLVEHLPPHVHLVLITRADPPLPMERLRGHGAVGEIRAAGLRFSPEETRLLLQQLLGSEIPRETIAETAGLLEDSTEGWAVGLQLAALSMRGQADPAAFARKIARHGHETITEYLLAEVLGNLPAAQRAILLQSSLFDRFCAPLLDAAQVDAGRLDGESFVRAIRRANLFVVALDEAGTWFRYHHFFQALLRVRLAQDFAPADVKTIHTRASRWFGAQALMGEAVVHALAAGDEEAAAGLVEAQVPVALDREDWRQLDRLLSLLPEGVSNRPGQLGRPRLILAHAWLHFFRWQFGALAARIAAAERSLDATSAADQGQDIGTETGAQTVPDTALRGEITLLRAALASAQGSSAATVALAEAALAALGPDLHFTLGTAQFYYVWGLQACGHYARAVEFAHRQLELHGWQANVVTLRLFLALGTAHFEMANLPAMQSVTTIWYRLAAQTSFGLSIGWSLFGLGWLHYQKNELELAEEYFGRLTAMAWAAHGRAVIDGYTGLVLIALARSRLADAQTKVDALGEHLLERGMSALAGVVQSLQQRVALAMGLDPALAWRRSPGAAPAGGDFWDQPDLTEVRTLLAAATSPAAQELVQAGALLAESRAFALSRHSHRRLIEIGGLQALVSAAAGAAAAASAALEEAVVLAARGGALRLLVDCGPALIPLLQDFQAASADGSGVTGYLQNLLEAFGVPAAASLPPPKGASLPLASPLRQPTPAELFTNREIDVLTLLAQRLGDKEIAAQLVLSPLTVKKHTQRLYRKLGVSSRRAAVAEARRLGLI